MARKRFASDQWVTVEALNDEGQGLAQVEGYTLEIDNALPGEAVRLAVLKRRGRTLRCLALAVQKGHPDRIPALCPQAGRTSRQGRQAAGAAVAAGCSSAARTAARPGARASPSQIPVSKAAAPPWMKPPGTSSPLLKTNIRLLL